LALNHRSYLQLLDLSTCNVSEVLRIE